MKATCPYCLTKHAPHKGSALPTAKEKPHEKDRDERPRGRGAGALRRGALARKPQTGGKR